MSETTETKKKKYEICVFRVFKDDECAECKSEIDAGDFVTRKDEKSLCLTCSDLGHLIYLPKGNQALSLRAGKYSELRAIALAFNRKQKCQERQGIFVEEAALERAREECCADEGERAEQRKQAAQYREKVNRKYIDRFVEQILVHFPSCPADEANVIAEHACRKHSGRVGRSTAAKEFELKPIELAVRAHIRHVHTDYDVLLMTGWSRNDARNHISSEVDDVIDRWRDSESLKMLD
jgi:hypothetical protein